MYLAPEAIRNAPDLDARSDLYAVGAVGYFLMTGRLVFQADSVDEILSHHLNTRPEPQSQQTPWTPHVGLEELILHCLEQDPADRPSDAHVLQRALVGCPCDPLWGTDDAAAWWAAYHARQSRTQRPTAGGATQTTMTVDIGDRVRHEPSV